MSSLALLINNVCLRFARLELLIEQSVFPSSRVRMIVIDGVKNCDDESLRLVKSEIYIARARAREILLEKSTQIAR